MTIESGNYKTAKLKRNPKSRLEMIKPGVKKYYEVGEERKVKNKVELNENSGEGDDNFKEKEYEVIR